MAFQTSKLINHSKSKLYSIVADVEKYPDFLPWIGSAIIYPKTNNFFEADLTIKFKAIEKTYTSEVFLSENSIKTLAKPDDIFKYLESKWEFNVIDDEKTMVEFFMKFEFHSKILQITAGSFLEQAASKMIKAFENRASSIS